MDGLQASNQWIKLLYFNPTLGNCLTHIGLVWVRFKFQEMLPPPQCPQDFIEEQEDTRLDNMTEERIVLEITEKRLEIFIKKVMWHF